MTNNDQDKQLEELTKYTREVVEKGGKTGLHRLGKLAVEMGMWDKAQDIYEALMTIIG